MDANRLWVIGAVLVMVLIVVGGWFLGVQPQLDQAAAATIQRSSIESTNTVNEAMLKKLEADNADIATLRDKLAELSASVPGDPQLPAFYDEVNAIAAANGVVVAGFRTSDAVPYEPVKPPVVAAVPAAGSTATPTPTATAAATPTPAATPSAGMPPVTSPLITPTSFAAVPIQLSLTGDSTNILAMVHGLQNARRLFLVNGLTTSVPPVGSTIAGVQATVSGLVYVVPTAEPAAQGAG